MVRLPRLSAAPGGRTCLDVLGKHPRQVALVNEADGQCDLAKRFVGGENEVLGQLQALMRQPPMRGASDRLLEGATEIADRKPASAGELLDTDVAAKILAQQLLGARLSPWREAPSNKLTLGAPLAARRVTINVGFNKGHHEFSLRPVKLDCSALLYGAGREGAR